MIPGSGKETSNCPGPPTVGGKKVEGEKRKNRNQKVLERWSHNLAREPERLSRGNPGREGKDGKGRRTKEAKE